MEEKNYRIFTINPGSTSTKIALFENKNQIFYKNIAHDSEALREMGDIISQLPYRKQMIIEALEKENITLNEVDAFSGRGGGLPPMHSGVYRINNLMCEHAKQGLGVMHAGLLGPLLARELSEKYGGEAFIVDPPGTDELQDVARITGFRDVFRTSRVHALNQKEVAHRYADSIKRNYQKLNLVIAHMGGGISVTAHEKGRMIDTVDISNGDGHMAPTRSGFIPAMDLIKICYSGKFEEKELRARVNRNGGWMEHLGTADGREIEARIKNGDHYAELIYHATQYQIAKSIGAYATVLSGKLDAILLTGGLANSKLFVSGIEDRISYIAPVVCIPGEFEMEALASGAIRALKGKETVYEYDGLPVWKGFEK